MIKLAQALPSFVERALNFPTPENFIATNASVAVSIYGNIYAIVNVIDHYLGEEGYFVPLSAWHNPRKAATNLTYLVELTPDLSVKWAVEMAIETTPTPPWDWRGFECPRLFSFMGAMFMTGCSSGTGDTPGAKFYMGRIDGGTIKDIRCLEPENPEHAEKNWMPEVVGDELRFHYRLGTLLDSDGKLLWKTGGLSFLGDLHGGTPVIPYTGTERPHEGGTLCIVHGYHPVPGTYRKVSRQHFVRMDQDGVPRGISPAIEFGSDSRLEIATGMAYHPDGKRLIVSYGRANADELMPHQERPFLATFDIAELGRIL